MQPAAKILALSWADRSLLLACVPLVAVIRLGLTLLSYRRLKRWIPTGGSSGPASAAKLGRIAWAVRNASRVVPQASCLTQALAAQYLLGRAGHPSRVRIGMAQDQSGAILAHAWLVSDGRVVIGGSDRTVARYTFLTDLEPGGE